MIGAGHIWQVASGCWDRRQACENTPRMHDMIDRRVCGRFLQGLAGSQIGVHGSRLHFCETRCDTGFES